jgi:lipopolysaccharide/colanic/teichoic acid biosynthesis glycosyltransferase
MASSGLAWSTRQQSVSGPLGQRVERVPDFQHLRLRLYGLILAGDGLAMALAFLSADLIRFGRLEGYGFTTFVVLFPTYVAVALNGDAWSIASLERPRHSAASAIRAYLLAIAIATVFFFSLKVGEDFSRLVFGIGSAIALGAISAVRLVLGKAIGRRYGWNFLREVMILDGVSASRSGKEFVVDAASDGLRPALDDPEVLDRLGRLLYRSERAIVACRPDRREAWTRALAGANVDVEILAPELSDIPAIGLRRHGSVPSLLVGCGPLRLRNRVLKRLLDVSVAGAGLVLLAPLMLVIAAAIRLESDGPALFRQVRTGRANRMFTMLKFRTMRCDAEDGDGARSVCRSDNRLTRVGRFLRRTSLDELPQIMNVLKGEMSIVGPRPHALGTRAGDRLLWAVDERYWDRHAIKPGLTGLAQVRGLRGATDTTTALTDRLQADLEYIDGWHIGRDLAIIARTIGVLVHPNAF